MAFPDGPVMPPDPVTDGTAEAIGWHHTMMELTGAGFTRDEAFAMVRARYREFWGSVYMYYAEHADDD